MRSALLHICDFDFSHLVARVRTIFIGACLVADVDCKLTVRSRQQQRPELYNFSYYRASQAHWLIIRPLDIVGIFDTKSDMEDRP